MASGPGTKRLKVEDGAVVNNEAELAAVLDRLRSCLLSPGEAGPLDDLLDELDTLQSSGLNGCGNAAFSTIAQVQERLQAAIVALQAAVDRFTPPPGYRPPAAGDEAFVRSLLSYAHRLSYTSSAPLGYQPGQPLYFFKPPAPQEAEMRASQLHAFAREWEDKQQAQEAQRQAAARGAAAPPAAPAAPQQPAAAAPAQPAPPAGDLAAMAAALGLDVQQLLASIPSGWKPGDPIPAMAPAAAAGAAAVQARAAAAAAAAPQQAQQAPQQQAAAPPPQREATPEEEGGPAPPAPRVGDIFFNPLDFQQYQYGVSSDEEDSEEDEEESD